jgi:hypothetical protein
MLNTPVLFIVFNRPGTTRQVFEAIRRAQPRQLFVAADGPRPDRVGEAARCEEVRKIATSVDWDCEVKTLFRAENLGCGLGPKTAIDWFFENVEKGIILEDDCLPHPSFFLFSEEMLNYYSEDKRISSISGTNLVVNETNFEYSYIFSCYAGIWGWATWKRAWRNYDYNVANWDNPYVRILFESCKKDISEIKFYSSILDQTRNAESVTWWDYQWLFSIIINSSFVVVPKVNLVSNIGFGADATHTFDSSSRFSNLDTGAISFPISHPPVVMADSRYDTRLSDVMFGREKKNNFWKNILNLIRNKIQ